MFIERTECPVCAGHKVSTVYSAPYVGSPVEDYLRPRCDRSNGEGSYRQRFAGHEFVVSACSDCNALFQKHAPAPGLAAEYYDTWIAAHGSPSAPFTEYTHRINEALVLTSLLLKRTGKRSPADLSVLDYGVGRGVFALAMRACGCKVSTYDLSSERMETARRNGLAAIEDSEIPGSGFDFINTEQVFEHLPAPRETTAHLVSGLNDRGILKISVPYGRAIESGPFRIDWNAPKYGPYSPMYLQPLEHLTYFRRPSLDKMMAGLGYAQVRLSVADELNYAFNWKGARQIAKNLVRPFIRDRIRNYFLYGRTAPG